MPDQDPTPLSRFAPGALAARRPSQRAELLLSDPDPAARVAALPAHDLYFLIKDLGIEEAQDLVALATPEQVQTFVDLDAWNRDQLDDGAVRPWLEALIAAGPEKLARVWRGLDPELAALLLARWVRVYNLAEEEVPDWEEPPFVATPDRFFLLKVLGQEPDRARLVDLLIDRLYRADPELARHTIRAASSEPPAELEEMSFRWRSGRMQDLGYASLDEALEVYRPLDPAGVEIGGPTAGDALPEPVTLPAIYVEPVRRGFLGSALARITSAAESARLEAALVALLNRVLAASRISPADTVAAAAAAAQGTATLSLGLETVSRGDLARAQEALRTVPLSRLHRAGHTVTLQLARLARALGPRAARAEEPFASVLAGLRAPRPQLARAADTPPDLGTRPFAAVADVRLATRALAMVAAQISIVYDALGIDPSGLGPATTLGDVGRTAIAHQLFGDPPSAAPLAPEAVRRFAASLAGGRLPEAAAEQVVRQILDLFARKKIAAPQECQAAIRGWIGDLEHELGSLSTDQPPDRRFVRGVLLE